MVSLSTENSKSSVWNRGVFDTSKITVICVNVPLGLVLKDVERQAGITFYFSSATVDVERKVSLDIRNLPLNEVLIRLFREEGVDYIKKGNLIIIQRKRSRQIHDIKGTSMLMDTVRPPYITIKGNIRGWDGNPVFGATVLVKDGDKSMVSDENGFFEISNVSATADVQFSSIGYETLVLKANKIGTQVILNLKVTELKNVEVISTGYQDLIKDKTTGSVVKIDKSLFNRQVGGDVLSRIYNVTSGLINDPNGENGGKKNIVVRGVSTFTASREPLIVVDNFPYEGRLDDLNPNDVESVTVLKDAAAAAIWGARAGNGVIVITTKSGKYNSKLNVNFSANVSLFSKPDIKYTPIMSSRDMVNFEKGLFSTGIFDVYDDVYPNSQVFPVLPLAIEVLLAAKRRGADPMTDTRAMRELEMLSSQDVREDILNYLIQNRKSQQYALNISGGGPVHSFYASMGFDKNVDENVGGGGDRMTLSAGNSFKLSKKLELTTRIVYSRNNVKQRGLPYSQFLLNNLVSPYSDIVDDVGRPLAIPKGYRVPYVDTAKYPMLLDWHYRPLEELNEMFSVSSFQETRLNASINYALLSWLKLSLLYQGELNRGESRSTATVNSYEVRDGINRLMTIGGNGEIIYPWPFGGVVDFRNSNLNSWSVRGGVAINKHWSNNDLNAVIGIERREMRSNTHSSKLYGFDPQTSTYQIVDLTTRFAARPRGSSRLGSPPGPTENLNRFGSAYSNVEYRINGKYTFSGSARIDQSNHYGVKANLRRVPLWSIGGNWSLHEERWFASSWISKLSFRASYGYTGNTVLGTTSYATFETLTDIIGIPPINGLKYGRIVTPNNPGLSWEKVKIVNLGVLIDLFQDRINSVVEYYQKRGEDLVGFVRTDPISGFTGFLGNQASIRGRGMDVTFNTVNLKHRGFEWLTTLLFSFNRNKATSFQLQYDPTAYDVVSGANNMVDYPLNSLFGFKWAGLDPENGSPRVILGDTMSSYSVIGDAKISDLVFKGTTVPKYFGSFLNTFRYKGISLSANIVYRLGYQFRRPSINYSELLNLDFGGWNAHSDYSMRWKMKGDELRTNVPSQPEFEDFNRDNAYLFSDINIEPGDHIRLKDIRISYDVGTQIISRLKVKSLQFYAYIDNIGLIWKANKVGLDPDAIVPGLTPQPRSFSIGLMLSY